MPANKLTTPMQLLWPKATIPPRLAADEAHVWAVPLVESEPSEHELLAALSLDEQARAKEFRFDVPRRQFIVTRGVLRILLGHYLGERPEEIAFAFEAVAKPRLANKYAASDLRFNVSHSGDLALIAATLGSDVGIDVEHCRPVKQLEQLAKRHFHSAEIAGVLATPSGARDAAFMRCWTGKEAVLKAFGVGIAGSLDAFQVPLAESFEGWIDLTALPKVGNASQCWLQRLVPCDDYVAAIALLGDERRVVCRTFSA